MIEAGALAQLRRCWPPAFRPISTAADITLCTSRSRTPEKILCVGVNFPDRNAEYKDGSDAPPFMSLFPRFPRSLHRRTANR